MSRSTLSARLRRDPDDIAGGDFVRHGHSAVGVVVSVDGDRATVSWGKSRRDILPVWALRRVRHRGEDYDSRLRR